MSHLVVLAFDDPEQAEKVQESLRKGEKGGYIDLKDSAVIVRDAEGKVHVKNEMDDGVKSGAIWGSLIGLFIGGLLFPIAGIALGALGGALLGKGFGDHIDKKFVSEVSETLQPGSSAIFFLFRGSDVSYALAALRPYNGQVLHTTLSEEAEQELRKELKKRGA
jgi:uncharacterized membrane protein